MPENENRPGETFFEPTRRSQSAARHPWELLALAALVALGCGLRLANVRDVFRGGEVDLLPSDSHYYVRFALLQLHAFPRLVRFDPLVNFPTGASILWPPLHTWLVALGVLAGGQARPELGAAWVGPAVSLGWLVGLAAYAWRGFGPRFALACTAGLAVLPAIVTQGALGNCDHHVHEPFLLALAVLTQARLWRSLERRDAVIAGAVLALGRWLTPAAFVFLVPAAAGVAIAAWALRDPRVARRGLELAAVTAGLLALSALLAGEPRALDYERLSAFHPLFAFATIGGVSALAGWALAGRARAVAAHSRDPSGATSAGATSTEPSGTTAPLARRWLALWAIAAVLCAVPLVASLGAALAHLGRADPLLGIVDESKPLTSFRGWREYLGVAVLLGPVAVFGVGWAIARRRVAAYGPMLAAVLGLAVAAASQQRFGRALDGALAVLIPVGLFEVGALLRGPLLRGPLLRGPVRSAAVAITAICALVSPLLAWPARQPLYDEMLARPTLRWMRAHTVGPPEPFASRGAPPAPAEEGGVVAPFVFGHLITLWAERPAVATPFSQAPWHVEGNARAAAVLSARTDEDAFARMTGLGARYLLATPFNGMLGAYAEDPAATQVARLLDGGGFEPGSSHFRLIHESAEQRRRAEGGSFARVFEVVAGARLEGKAEPSAPIEVSVPVRSNLGVVRTYRLQTRADGSGRFALRLAHPVGAAGEVRALSDYEVRSGNRLIGSARPSEADVLEGRPVALIPPAPADPAAVANDLGGLSR